MQVLIIGAGISGLVCAERLASAGFEVQILEKRNNIAGNAFDYEEDNILVQKYGPHIFHTNNEEVFRYLDQFCKFNNFRHEVLGVIDGKSIPIPFNFTGVDTFFPHEKEEIKLSLVTAFGLGARITIFDLQRLNTPLLKRVADFVFEKIFKNYTEKMWNLPVASLDPQILKRVPVNVSYDSAYFNDKYQGIPQAGYTKGLTKLLANPRIKLRLNVDATKLLKVREQKLYYHGNVVDFPIIYCGPIDELLDYEFEPLDYRSLDIQFIKLNQEYFQKTAVVNYPNDLQMTRITEYKHFTDARNPRITIISKEYPGDWDRHSARFHTPYYPVGTTLARVRYQQYFDRIKGVKHLYLLGRLAEYKYINMDQAVANALNLARRIKEEYCGN